MYYHLPNNHIFSASWKKIDFSIVFLLHIAKLSYKYTKDLYIITTRLTLNGWGDA